MCLLCIEIAKANMNVREAVRAYIELDQDEHTDEIIKVLTKAYGADKYVDAILAEVSRQESKA